MTGPGAGTAGTGTVAAPGGHHDPVTFELVKNALFFLVNEMALTLVRASYSGILRENMDFSTGIATPGRRDGHPGPVAAAPVRTDAGCGSRGAPGLAGPDGAR